MSFVPLHVYSGYSYLKSALKVETLASLAKKYECPYLALSEYGTMSSYPNLYHVCKKAGLKPIYGLDVELGGALLSLFVTSEEGYRNLLSIDYSYLQGKLTLQGLLDQSEGLEIILDLAHSPLYSLLKGEKEKAASYLHEKFHQVKRLYLGLDYLPKETWFAKAAREFVEDYTYEILAYPEIRYEKPDGELTLLILEAISSGSSMTIREAKGDRYYLSPKEAEGYYTNKELHATEVFAANCSHFDFLKKRGSMLIYPNPKGISSELYLRDKAYEGLRKKGLDQDERYLRRLEYELSIIVKMGYSDYFLLVADYVNFAKDNGILVGPGRGSGVSSLVSYCLNIITVDPLKYDLLFERFLNPERASMPDIDVDFIDTRREEVIVYLQRKYGYDKVAHILGVSTIGPKAAIQDIGRVYGYQEAQVKKMSKAIAFSLGNGLKSTLGNNYRYNKDFRTLIDSDEYYRSYASLARRIEGLPRQATIHAAGIVLNSTPLHNVVPSLADPLGNETVQFENESDDKLDHYLEEQGFLKMDLLGLTNLSIVERCLMIIKDTKGIELEYEAIPHEDEKAIGLISSNLTMGLFQLESPGMNKAIRQIRPSCFEDVVALISLFRPGPMENIPLFAKRKSGLEKIDYIDPCLEGILKSTYGVIVYQEQIMLILETMAGYSLAKADNFRRAISKKDESVFKQMKPDFIESCLKLGHQKEVAEKVYSLIYEFARYGFNKSHAVAYAKLACQMAYLKAYYPNAFYCAILFGQGGSQGGKFGNVSSEMKKLGIRFELPDINLSGVSFYPSEKGVIFGLSCIKGIGERVAYAIVEERGKGEFTSFHDFVIRTHHLHLDDKALLSLIDAGCFDSFGHSRASLRNSVHAELNYAEMSGEGNLLLDIGIPAPTIKEISENTEDRLYGELSTLGVMVSGSPLDKKRDKIISLGAKRLSEAPDYERCLVSGIVKSVRVVNTKSGRKMAFLTLYDEESELDAVLFEDAYNASYPALKEGNLVTAELSKDKKREGSFLSSKVEIL